MRKNDFFEEKKLKRLIYVFSITLIISIIVFASIFFMYNKKLKEESNNNLLELGKLNDIVSNDELEEFEETSSTSDKNMNDVESASSLKDTKVSKKENSVKNNTIQNNSSNNKNNTEIVQNIVKGNNVENSILNATEVSEKKELNFMAPVSGEILKDFALDTLIYSNTLEEWTTHSGIDIQAEKTSVVVASETGTVESIKTDPRYGLTIIITHDEGFKTIYSNLLTTEFVTEGQVVEKGQTIATIGESSSFEIADESHLHFEIYKDGNCVNPTIYLKEI